MIGIIAEDSTDTNALKVLIRRILGANGPKVQGIAKNGCGEVRRKGARWMKTLARRGATHIIVVHDLDRNNCGALNDENALFGELSKQEKPGGVLRHICIPVEELEAWFWACPKTLSHVSHGSHTKRVHHPNGITSPKKALMALSRKANRRPTYSTNDNAKLAGMLDIEVCMEKCSEFKGFVEFVRDYG